MPWKWTIVTPPTALPITYQQASRHLRLNDDTDQPYILQLIQAATDFVQNEIHASLMMQTIQASHFDIPGQYFYLPRGPVQSITSVMANGLDISSSLYSAEGSGNDDSLYCKELLAPPVIVTYVAGFSSLPNDLMHAVLVQLSQSTNIDRARAPSRWRR